MVTSLLDRIGLGNARAVANAHREVLRRQEEERIVAALVDALTRHEVPLAARALRGADAARTSGRDAAA